MKIYLVGGAVRDKLLGLTPKENDWVVVGATVDDMMKLGYKQVGKDFPVFLHPETKEEYALARTERKVGRGYTGFSFDTSPDVTLEEDLKRRDLTINAIAENPDGKLIDPYHGKEDLDKKLLRHVSPAFSEDPVRILRIARFAARFAELGFHIAPETTALMKQMVISGEVDALVAERVWKELERALAEKHPEEFFFVLADCDALFALFPELSAQGPEMNALIRVTEQSLDPIVRFAALLHGVSEEGIKKISERYRAPSEYRELALLIARYLPNYQKASQLSAKEILDLLLKLDAFRREDRFEKFLLASAASSETSSSAWLKQCLTAAKSIDARAFVDAGIQGKEIAEKLNEKRQEAIQKLIRVC